MEITLGNIVFGGSSTGGTGGGNWTEDKEFATAEAFCTLDDRVYELDDRVSTLESSSGSSLDLTDVWYIYAPANCHMKVVNQNNQEQDVTTSNGIIKYSDFPNGVFAYSNDVNIRLEKIICMGKANVPSLINQFDGIYAYANVTTTPFYQFESLNSLMNTWLDCQYLTNVPHFNTEYVTNFNNTWAGCWSLLTIPPLNFKSATDISQCFNGCFSLTTLPYMNLASVTDATNAWGGCNNLTTLGGFGAIRVDIDLSSSPNLTVDSLMNVINQAADLNALGIAGITMTLGNDNLAKLTDEQKAVATNKGWTLA